MVKIYGVEGVLELKLALHTLPLHSTPFTWWRQCWVKLCGYAGNAHVERLRDAVPVIDHQVVAVQVR